MIHQSNLSLMDLPAWFLAQIWNGGQLLAHAATHMQVLFCKLTGEQRDMYRSYLASKVCAMLHLALQM